MKLFQRLFAWKPDVDLTREQQRRDQKLALNLKRARIDAGLTQQMLADRIGTGIEFVRQMENPAFESTRPQVRAYILGLGLEIHYIIQQPIAA
jgi:DNA-binding XRE family transcriptional regulator